MRSGPGSGDLARWSSDENRGMRKGSDSDSTGRTCSELKTWVISVTIGSDVGNVTGGRETSPFGGRSDGSGVTGSHVEWAGLDGGVLASSKEGFVSGTRPVDDDRGAAVGSFTALPAADLADRSGVAGATVD